MHDIPPIKAGIRRQSEVVKGGRPPKYHFHLLKIGDSFELDANNVQSARYAAYTYGRNHGVKLVVAKDVAGAWRCWRVELGEKRERITDIYPFQTIAVGESFEIAEEHHKKVERYVQAWSRAEMRKEFSFGISRETGKHIIIRVR